MIKYDFYHQEKNYENYGVIFIKFIVYGLVLLLIMRVHEKKL